MARDLERLAKRREVAKAAHGKHNTRASRKVLKRAQRQLQSARAALAIIEAKNPKKESG